MASGRLFTGNNQHKLTSGTTRQKIINHMKKLLPLILLCTVATSYAQYAAQPLRLPRTGEVLKGDGAGGAVVATAGSDFATVAQATHSGGVIGTASFRALAASIIGLVHNGVVTGVEYCESGQYTVNLSGQFDVNYIAVASLGGDSADNTWSYNIPAKDKETVSFSLVVRVDGSKSDESDNIQIAVMRLSQ
jgi:hypothetical protein